MTPEKGSRYLGGGPPKRQLFKKDWLGRDKALTRCMYGAGLVRAKEFIQELRKTYQITA